jgi:hypothetical protein
MFSKSFIALISVFALTTSVNAHAAVAPLLGVNGPPTLNDVQKPTASSPCGNVDISDNLSTSTAAAANGDGEFIINITNFELVSSIHIYFLSTNRFADVKTFSTTDGSRKINSVDIDSTGTGNNFNAQGSVIANGDAVRGICYAPYPRADSCSLESYESFHAAAPRPAC